MMSGYSSCTAITKGMTEFPAWPQVHSLVSATPTLQRWMAVLNENAVMAGASLCREDSDSSVVRDELDVLGSVYLDEMKVVTSNSRRTELQFHLTPSTADNKERQYVYLDLQLSLPLSYPHTPPNSTLLKSRGLADTQLQSIQAEVRERCSELLGGPMIYEVVESIKEALTASNRPCGQCTLCLCDFMGGDEEFTKTECYHYFHSACLVRYVRYYQRLATEEGESEGGGGGGGGGGTRPLECPVCRDTISLDSRCLKQTAYREKEDVCEEEREEEEFVFVPSQSLQQWQHQMAVLLQQQKERGGVIDLAAKDDAIDLTWVSRRKKEESATTDTTEEREAMREEQKTESVREVLRVTSQSTLLEREVTSQSTEPKSRPNKCSSFNSMPRITVSSRPNSRPSAHRHFDTRSWYRSQGIGTGHTKKQSGGKPMWNGMRTEQSGNETTRSGTRKGCRERWCDGGREEERCHERGCDNHSRRERGGGRGWEGGQREGRERESQAKSRRRRGRQPQWKNGVTEGEKPEQNGGQERTDLLKI